MCIFKQSKLSGKYLGLCFRLIFILKKVCLTYGHQFHCIYRMSSSYVRRCFGLSTAAEDAAGDCRHRTHHELPSQDDARSTACTDASPDEGEVTLQGPGWLRWAPTSELELYNAEAAILGPIRPIISQRMVAGLNTIATVHPKVRNVDGSSPSSAQLEEREAHPTPTPVAFFSAMPGDQKEALCPLDADTFTSIVFVHGYAGGVANWLPVWRAFAAANDVYAFDLPGFARSTRPAGRPFNGAQDAINWYVGQFESWFGAMRLGLEAGADGSERPPRRRVVLVGHSFGGYLCSQFAMRHPEVVDHLVLVDAWGVHRHIPLTPEEEAKKKAEQSYASLALNWAMDGIYWSKLLRGMGPAAKSIFCKARPEFMDTWAPHLDDPRHFYDYTYHCNAQHPHIGERAFARIRCPKSGPFAAQRPLFVYRARFPRTIRTDAASGADLPMVGTKYSEDGADLTSVAQLASASVSQHCITSGSGSSFASPTGAAGAFLRGACSGTPPPPPPSSPPPPPPLHGRVLSTDEGASDAEQPLIGFGRRGGAPAAPAAGAAAVKVDEGAGYDQPLVPGWAAQPVDGKERREPKTAFVSSLSEGEASSRERPAPPPPLSAGDNPPRESEAAVTSSSPTGSAVLSPLPPATLGSEGSGGLPTTDLAFPATREARPTSTASATFASSSCVLSPTDDGGYGDITGAHLHAFPLHLPPRRNFKLTLLYGETSWLRGPDVEALGPLLEEEYGTDVSYSVVPRAGHMVMADNAADFTEALMRRL